MTGGKIMKRKFVIDTSIFLIYASHNKLYRLADAAIIYGLLFYINDELIAELKRNIPRVIQASNITADDIIKNVLNITIHVNTINKFTESPDAKDNFLFDLALQTGSDIIVTQEKALLGFTSSPVEIHDLKWFKENYPVPL